MATAEYDKKNCTRINLKLNNKTDADIIEKLGKVGNVQGFIKNMIREEINMKRYEVALANKETIFDSAAFDTIPEIIDWISGRGGIYTAQIARSGCAGVTISVNDEDGTMSWFDGFEWNKVTEEQISKLIG